MALLSHNEVPRSLEALGGSWAIVAVSVIALGIVAVLQLVYRRSRDRLLRKRFKMEGVPTPTLLELSEIRWRVGEVDEKLRRAGRRESRVQGVAAGYSGMLDHDSGHERKDWRRQHEAWYGSYPKS